MAARCSDRRARRGRKVQDAKPNPQGRIDHAVSGGLCDALLARLLARALDEVDYGVVLLRADGYIVHMNDEARRRLRNGCGLLAEGPVVTTRHEGAAASFAQALRACADGGARRLVDVSDRDVEDLVALVPMEPHVAALLLGKAAVCEDLALECFARLHGLTTAEVRVLAALGAGATPGAIALAQGVKLSTVRTQIGALREKTGTSSITALVRLVAALPPMINALHHGSLHDT